uniref:Uncharacterized protein n=2 Tax=Eucampia antarctica TaxID=49252 RepID=A0A7S2RIR2_9STRA
MSDHHHKLISRNSVLYSMKEDDFTNEEEYRICYNMNADNNPQPEDDVPMLAPIYHEMVEKRPPLSFRFCGYTLWLEPEQFDNDLSQAMSMACTAHGLHPIPSPHITLIYGMTHLTETEVQHLFRHDLQLLLRKGWGEPFQSIGILADKTFDGVNGENMV